MTCDLCLHSVHMADSLLVFEYGAVLPRLLLSRRVITRQVQCQTL